MRAGRVPRDACGTCREVNRTGINEEWQRRRVRRDEGGCVRNRAVALDGVAGQNEAEADVGIGEKHAYEGRDST
jgi:hypothetical protein